MLNIWIRELFINLSILITLILIGSQFFMKNGINKKSNIQKKIALGVLGGLFGVILISFTMVIPINDVFIDMRNIPILLTSIYGGPISTVITVTILSIFRWIKGGLTIYALRGVISICLVGVFNIIISTFKLTKKIKYIYITISTTIITNLFLVLALQNKRILISIIFLHTITFLIASVITYILTRSLERNYHVIKGLEKESTEDFLTGLSNVRAFDSLFNDIVRDIKEKKEEEISVLMIDIDHFKNVNDTYGHKVGDIVLSQLGRLLNESVREADIVARIGGEEFCVILRKPSTSFTLEIAERIRSSVENNEFIINEEKPLNITISIGAAIYPKTVDDIERIKEISDNNLYKAKNLGRNRIVL